MIRKRYICTLGEPQNYRVNRILDALTLIAYLILQLLSIPEEWGHTLLDKFRYLQSCMCQKISYVHWFEEMMFC